MKGFRHVLKWLEKWRARRREQVLARLAERGRPPPSEAERNERPADAEMQGGWAGGGGRHTVYGYEDESQSHGEPR